MEHKGPALGRRLGKLDLVKLKWICTFARPFPGSDYMSAKPVGAIAMSIRIIAMTCTYGNFLRITATQPMS
jgi:hypothetical protein